MTKILKPNLDDVRSFFSIISSDNDFTETVQVFADREKVKFDFGRLNYLNSKTYAKQGLKTIPRKMSVKIPIRGNKHIIEDLVTLQKLHYGVYFMVQNGKGISVDDAGNVRSNSNVESIRLLFLDLDGTPLDDVLALTLFKPHVIVESSPNKYHCYWKVQDCELDDYKAYQKALAIKFAGDPSVNDLARVARIPGFYHQKEEPFCTRIHTINPGAAYIADTLIKGLGLTKLVKEAKAPLVDPMMTNMLIPQGNRHQTLVGYARKYAAQGKTSHEIQLLLSGLTTRMQDAQDFAPGGSRHNEIEQVTLAALNYQSKDNHVLEVQMNQAIDTYLEENPLPALEVVTADNISIDMMPAVQEVPSENKTEVVPDEVDESKEPESISYNLSDHIICSKQLLNTFFKENRFVYYQENWFRYNKKNYYELYELSSLRRLLRNMLHPFTTSKLKLKEQTLSDIIKVLSDELSLPSDFSPESWFQPEKNKHEYINFSNCLFNMNTQATCEHSPDFFSLAQLPYEYNPDAQCPNFISWINDVWDYIPEADKKNELLQSLQQFFGYTLSKKVNHQAFLLLMGASRGGKGTLCRIIKNMIGEANTFGVGLSQLANSHGLEGLTGKKLVLVEETPPSIHPMQLSSVVEFIKRITGGDTITVNPKGKKQYNVTPIAKFVMATEYELPFKDAGGGLLNRAIIVPFEKSFAGKENSHLLDTFLNEMSGIFNWAFSGYKLLQDTKKLIRPAISKDERDSYTEDINPIAAWLDKTYDFNATANDIIMVSELYDSYSKTFESNEHFKMTKQFFSKLLKSIMRGRAIPCRHKNYRAYSGLRVRFSDSSYTVPDNVNESEIDPFV